MLFLILLGLSGFLFYDLAEKHGKSLWSYTILGCIIFFVSFVLGNLINIYLFRIIEITKETGAIVTILLDFIAYVFITFGLPMLFYGYLRFKWKDEIIVKNQDDILDSNI